MTELKFVFVGLSITSSWGNGHATTYRGLVRELCRRGHDVLFLERDVPYYASNRDLPKPPYGRTALYQSLDELRDCFGSEVERADAVVVGSYVPDGVQVGDWVLSKSHGVRAFYDIDTPVTLRALRNGGTPYLEPRQVSEYDLYLTFAGGPVLSRLNRELGARMVRPLYCSADPESYPRLDAEREWDLGYLGTYSSDRQAALEYLLMSPARSFPEGRFIVAGPQYPDDIRWPENVARVPHVAPPEHAAFYAKQRFTLSVTRRDMLLAGYSPSVRLFEAAACGTPVITDAWRGLDLFFEPEIEIIVARSADDVLAALRDMPESERVAIGERAQRRFLREHTAAHRAEALESYVLEAASKRGTPRAERAAPRVSLGLGGEL